MILLYSFINSNAIFYPKEKVKIITIISIFSYGIRSITKPIEDLELPLKFLWFFGDYKVYFRSAIWQAAILELAYLFS